MPIYIINCTYTIHLHSDYNELNYNWTVFKIYFITCGNGYPVKVCVRVCVSWCDVHEAEWKEVCKTGRCVWTWVSIVCVCIKLLEQHGTACILHASALSVSHVCECNSDGGADRAQQRLVWQQNSQNICLAWCKCDITPILKSKQVK